jgi:hypothetical protein
MAKRKKKKERPKTGKPATGGGRLATRSGASKPDAEASPKIVLAMAQIDRLLGLMPRPISVQTSAAQDGRELHNWDVVAPAMLFSAASCLLSLRWLAMTPPPRREQDASILLRRLYEHVVSFAWIATDPAPNAKRWVAYDHKYRLKIDDELRAMGRDGVEPATRAAFEAYIQAHPPMPPLDQRATKADEHWLPILAKHTAEHKDKDVERTFSMRNEYTTIYRPTSANAHPTPRSLFSYVNPAGGAGKFSIGFDMNFNDEDRFAYTFAPLVFATMLLISEHVLGYPKADDVFAAFTDAARAEARK